MKKRIALLLLTGACLMNTVPCFASQSVKVSYVGSQGTAYAALPGSETLLKDVGFKPKAPAALAGGYQFDSGRITDSFDLDAGGAQVNKQKGISFKYVKKPAALPNQSPCPRNRHLTSPFQKILPLWSMVKRNYITARFRPTPYHGLTGMSTICLWTSIRLSRKMN